MKQLSLAALLLLMAFHLSVFAEAPPELSAKAAIEIAQNSLSSRNLEPKIFISSLTFQSTALMGGKRAWLIQWSGYVEGSKPGSRELGLQIGMDGSVVHVIKEPGSGPQPGTRPR